MVHNLSINAPYDFFLETDEDEKPTGALQITGFDRNGSPSEVWLTNAPWWMIDHCLKEEDLP